MANYGWNSRQPYLHHNTNAQIACRLCSQVFTNREALIAHIDSHLAYEEITLKTLHHHPNQQNTSSSRIIDQPFGNHQFIIPNFPRVSPSRRQEITRNVSADTRSFWASSMVAPPPPQAAAMVVPHPPRRNPDFFSAINRAASASTHQPPSLGFSSTILNNNNIGGVTTQQFQGRNLQAEEMYTNSSDGTKPFLKMLDRPIKKIDFIDLVNIDDAESDSQALDLTLKL